MPELPNYPTQEALILDNYIIRDFNGIIIAMCKRCHALVGDKGRHLIWHITQDLENPWYCSKCHFNNQAGTRVCTHCGEKRA